MRRRVSTFVGLAFVAFMLVATYAAAQTETIEYYGTDAVGSVRIVFNASGTVLGRQDYDPFGQEILAAWGVPPERFGGQTADSETEQEYFHAREFDGRLGRFGSPDPLGGNPQDPQSWNRYAYSFNNPVRFIDLNGLAPKSKDGLGFDCGPILAISPNDYWCNPPSSPSPALFSGVRIPIVGGGGGGFKGTLGNGKSAPGLGGGNDSGEYVVVVGGGNPSNPVSPVVKVCGGGGFLYVGGEWGKKSIVSGEAMAIVEYDSETGGSHGGLVAIDFGSEGFFGAESMRTWSDWETHTTPIYLQGDELSASRKFGKHVKPGTVDVGGFATPEGPGKLSLGVYAGAGPVGGGTYGTLTVNSCSEENK